MLDQFVADLQLASKGLLDEAMINRGAKWIEALEDEFPWFYNMLMAILYDPPENVLHGLILFKPELAPLRDDKHVLAYIRRLQARLRGESK